MNRQRFLSAGTAAAAASAAIALGKTDAEASPQQGAIPNVVIQTTGDVLLYRGPMAALPRIDEHIFVENLMHVVVDIMWVIERNAGIWTYIYANVVQK